jgi:poly(3-hydroxybutyrate) depolymerase
MKRSQLFLTCLFLCLLAVPGLGQNIVQLSLKSEVLGEERTLLVRTPRNYEQSEERYPVLYMTDGAAHFAHTNSTIEFLARNGRMPEMIVVAINNTDRTRDLTPTKAPLQNGANRPATNFPTAGGADKFLAFIQKELIPQIEGNYRTHPYRIFAGHSFGGLLALHAFLNHTEMFNAYLAVSPTMHIWPLARPCIGMTICSRGKPNRFSKPARNCSARFFSRLAMKAATCNAALSVSKEFSASNSRKVLSGIQC